MTIRSDSGWLPLLDACEQARVHSDDVTTSMPTAASAGKGHTREPYTSAAHARECDVMDCCSGDGVVVVGRATCMGVHMDRRATGTAAPAWLATCTLVAHTGGIALQISNGILCLVHIACQHLNISSAENCSNGIFKTGDK